MTLFEFYESISTFLIAGFIFGVLVTIILYLIMVFQIKFTPLTSSLVCTFLGAVLTLGLAFTSQTRLMVLLMIPQFFTSKWENRT